MQRTRVLNKGFAETSLKLRASYAISAILVPIEGQGGLIYASFVPPKSTDLFCDEASLTEADGTFL
jgi:hypothetical protein